MLSKCANPGCPASFLYLHQGKLFRLDTAAESPSPVSAPKSLFIALNFSGCATSVAAEVTLNYSKGIGLTTVSLSCKTQSRAASAS